MNEIRINRNTQNRFRQDMAILPLKRSPEYQQLKMTILVEVPYTMFKINFRGLKPENFQEFV